jgi:hypothetical protein
MFFPKLTEALFSNQWFPMIPTFRYLPLC